MNKIICKHCKNEIKGKVWNCELGRDSTFSHSSCCDRNDCAGKLKLGYLYSEGCNE